MTETSGRISTRPREEILIGWTEFSSGWMALNSDGACRKTTEQVAIRGVLRDSNGQWRGGYAMKL